MSAKGVALDIPRDMGVEEVRSQNGCGARAEESADFFQHGGELFDIAESNGILRRTPGYGVGDAIGDLFARFACE
jgi:hypothetical protein